jgi:hypothetical protein
VRLAVALALAFVLADRLAAIKIDISLQDVDRALVISRGRDVDRAKFHAAYIQKVDQEFIETAEVVTEFRRVVLLAEEHAGKGDRFFGYSMTRANEALQVWKRRVSIRARVRLHPQNNYVNAPPVTMAMEGNERALIGVLRDAIHALPPGRTGEFVPVLGAVVEGVFEAEAIGQATRTFVVSLEKRDLGRFAFDFATLE